ncbi:nucleoprotein TPR isoform X2 [Drosophila grimshawi]|uniref:nucleoprotein TPR isoform X2 n=1 Tax=Drosophila grimshawi TaxID=7222 RepID=UPI000C871651|nr:nucleoprotein TPR isoform X2 [Drosophila grimshawi]
MDLSGPQSLAHIFAPDELQQLPTGLQHKLKSYIDGFFDEYCKERAAAHRLSETEQKNEELQNQILDNQVKFTNFEQNVTELRTQLDQVSAERDQLLESVKTYDQNAATLRKEKVSFVDERDSLLKVIERQNGELERLKQDLQTYQQQLRAAITAKCEAIARLDEVQSKELSLDMKERRLESERAMLQNEIQLLSSDLNRNNAELQNLRRDHNMNTMHLEVRLKEKCDELQIIQGQNAQYLKCIEDLNKKIEDLNKSMFQHNTATEKFVDTLKKELDTKQKLVDIYKNADSQNIAERNELLKGISDLKRMLTETTDQYGELEAEFQQYKEAHTDELTALNKTIDSLKQEIAHAGDLLKEAREQSLESAICKMAPTAAVANRLMRSDMSLTELYSLYAKNSEELEGKNRENAQLKLQIKSIVEEINERAPVFKKQDDDYIKLNEAHTQLLRQRDEIVEQKLSIEQELEQTQFDVTRHVKENKKLKQSQVDLSRQVCLLLDELNCLRAGVNRPRNQSQSGIIHNSSEAISRDLVTFDSIAELQSQNVKLLSMIRELTTELEAYELRNDQLQLKAYEEKLEKATKRFAEIDEELNQKNNTIATLMAKCEHYKKLYFDAQKKLGSQIIDIDDSIILIDESKLEQSKAVHNAQKLEAEAKLERRIRSLEQQLENESKKYAALKENYEYYTSEKRKNDALVQEQFDSMRKEVRELTSGNCKLINANEFQKEQIELLQKGIAAYKQQIAALEDRTKNYEKTIIKHEQTIHMLKDEVMTAHNKQVTSETETHNLRHENRVLKDTTARLQAEKEGYNREHQNQALLLNNLEFIKANLERSETEGRLRLEQRLDDTVRELSAQRRHFYEEEEKFRGTLNEFKRQTETANKLKEEERQHAEKWHNELNAVREELAAKVSQVNDLSKKLQESLTPSKDENPITAANKKAREFELRYGQARIEIESLTKELAKTREHGDQFYKMSQSAESEIKRLHDMHADIVAKAEAEIKKLKSSEAELQTRVTDLEAELMLSNVTEQSKSTNQSDQLKIAQEELKNVLEKLTESGRAIRTLRAENSTLAESLNAVEVKYANEMVLHSSDIQELSKFKTDFLKVQDELNQLKNGRESLQNAHDELLKANAEAQITLQKEMEESEKRVSDLNALNASLHDQIEALTTKLAALAQTASSTNMSLNESLMEAATSTMELSSSMTAMDEIKSSEQLLKIIKFLRKEKDLYAAKLDILKAENARLVSEHTLLQKKVDELNGYLKQERSKSETDVVSASKHEAVLRKIETLNAITDSNRILREERNALTKRVAELTERISSVEKELFPLQCGNKELTSKIEELNVENTSLRTEAIKWRQRANALVEKSNRNPEEFKRLQAERESLAKLLTTEKEVNKKQLDELTSLKSRLENEIPALNRNLQMLDEARKKQMDESMSLKQTSTRQAQDIMELKNRLLQKEEELLKAQEELETKDKVIQDKDSKEIMLRKLAKRYKDYYTGLQAQSGGTDTVAELEKVRSELDELNNTMRSTKEQHEKLQKEHDELKARSNVEQASGESKQKIEQLLQELTVTKTELTNQESALAGTKTSYDETVQRLEKELQDHIASNKDINARLQRENESLHMRINQLQRQLGNQQSTKPSTSSVGMAEKGSISESSPRTANVKPMSGSATVQQSATVTPWRGGETPLASIRPISVQNSRTAAILPTSQQPGATTSSTSTSTSTSSAAAASAAGSSSTSSSSSSSTTSSSAVGNTALVPPQQQVHTTGSATLESMASSSPTSSHTDYMPSTSSASVAVAAIPPMGASATAAAESSQEAESVQHPQQNDAQLFVGGAQQQVVALVSPRVEGSSSSSSSSTTTTSTPTVPSVQDASTQQQPSTSGSSSSSSTVVSSHSRHTPSSSNVTTTQAGCSKRPRDVEGDSSTNAEEGVPEKIVKLAKRMRVPMHGGELSAGHIGDSGMDVDQMPTSSQRDQEDEIQVVDSDDDEEEEDALGPIDGGDAEQEEGYEDSYEQDNEMEDNDGADDAPDEHNEVDVEQVPVPAQAESQLLTNSPATTVSTQQENNQSQAITSGSGESNTLQMPQAEANWKQQAPSTSTAAAQRGRTESSVEIVSSPQVSNFSEQQQPTCVEAEVDGTAVAEAAAAADDVAGTSASTSVDYTTAAAGSSPQKPNEAAEQSSSTSSGISISHTAEAKDNPDEGEPTGAENVSEADEAFAEETTAGQAEESSQQLSNENPNVGTSQSLETENQENPAEGPSEDNEGADGVSSEGEKQAVEVEEEGREAEATSPSENTRFRNLRSAVPARRGGRSIMRGNNSNSNNANRPARIVWQRDNAPGNMRGHPGMQDHNNMPSGSPNSNRIFANRSRGRRPMRRPGPNNFNPGGGGYP